MPNVNSAQPFDKCALYDAFSELTNKHVNGYLPPGEGTDNGVPSDKIGAEMRGCYIHPITKKLIETGPIYQLNFREFAGLLNRYDGEREQKIRNFKSLTSQHSMLRIAGGAGAGAAIVALATYIYYHNAMSKLQAQDHSMS
jgi:hypothetical protein